MRHRCGGARAKHDQAEQKSRCCTHAFIMTGFSQKSKTPRTFARGVLVKPAMIYFRVVHTIMDPKCLTAVFGMGTGVATWVWSPARRMAASSFSARRVRRRRGAAARDRAGAKRRIGGYIKKAADRIVSGCAPCQLRACACCWQGEDQCGQALGC